MGSAEELRGRPRGTGAPLDSTAGREGAPAPEADRDGPPLVVRGLSVTFPIGEAPLRAVRGVDLSVNRGECLGVVGESGSGKSVAFAATMGLLPRDAVVEGEIHLNGRNLLAMEREEVRSLRGRVISMIFQEPGRSFDPIYSMGKTFEETFRAKNPAISRAEARERAVRLLREVHVPQAEERLSSFPHQLSGGMLQRVMIALALANDPEVLIADEPTTALDVTIQAQIVGLLAELRERRRLSLVFITHDLGLVGQIADRIQVMYAGLVLETGEASEVLRRPHSPYTRSLLSALPSWGAHYSREGLFTIKGSVPNPTRHEPGCPFAPRCYLAVEACTRAIPPLDEDRERPAATEAPAGSAGAEAAGASRLTPEAAGASGALEQTAGAWSSLYRCIFPGVKK